ncbi:hypothetical protein RHGRI_034295 [Rhododendron griersonianum]|uniref:Uncharacterized protein n=1 Tax=Rhododendron griersonianum TaxID=479676 RepID=A0AAV6I2W3_9ERIC|nr:hypothetical protein RHGRI_034295 [Rhododendron griersonianum]
MAVASGAPQNHPSNPCFMEGEDLDYVEDEDDNPVATNRPRRGRPMILILLYYRHQILQTLDLHSRKPNLQTPAQSTASHRRPPPAIADAHQPLATFLQVIPTSSDLLNLLDLLRHSPQSKPNLHTLAQPTTGHRHPPSAIANLRRPLAHLRRT